jgi:transcriptional regulator with XRE-family HTH domain
MYESKKSLDNSPRLKIGKNLRKIRDEKGLSREELSKEAVVSLNTVVMVETRANANPTIETLIRIAKALGKKVEDFLK